MTVVPSDAVTEPMCSDFYSLCTHTVLRLCRSRHMPFIQSAEAQTLQLPKFFVKQTESYKPLRNLILGLTEKSEWIFFSINVSYVCHIE